MIRTKSRNFILTICAVLITLVIAVSSFLTAFKVSSKYTEESEKKKTMNNVVCSSTNVKLTSGGNFNTSTPEILGLDIINFNVRLSKAGDKVEYEAKYCNKNKQAVRFVNFWVSDINCTDYLGESSDCSNILIESGAYKDSKELKRGEIIDSGDCFEVVMKAKYIGEFPKITDVLVDKNSIELAVVRK